MNFSPTQIAEFDKAVTAARTPADLENALSILTSALGFDGFVLGARIPGRTPIPVQLIVSSLSPEWSELYDQREFLAHDPLIEKAIWAVTPFTFDECDHSHPKAVELREVSLEWGYSHGIAAPMHGPKMQLGLLILVRRDPPITEDGFLRSQLFASAQFYGMILFNRLIELGTEKFLNSIPGIVELSAREREVLLLTALGKRAKEVARDLDISARTVGFHLARTVAKLGVKTVKNAIVKAALDGTLCVIEYPATMRAGTSFTSVHKHPRVVVRDHGTVTEIGEYTQRRAAKSNKRPFF